MKYPVPAKSTLPPPLTNGESELQVAPLLVMVFADVEESVVRFPLSVANIKNLVSASAVNGAVGTVKLVPVYLTLEFHLKLVILPFTKFLAVRLLGSAPIYKLLPAEDIVSLNVAVDFLSPLTYIANCPLSRVIAI